MGYRLRDNLYCCLVGDQAVCLDLEADRYFLIPREAYRALTNTRASALAPAPNDAVLRRLIDKGIVHKGLGLCLADQLTMQKTATLDPAIHATSPALLTEAISFQAAAAVKLRLSPLWRVVNSLKRRKATSSLRSTEGATDELMRVASAFRASGKFFNSDGRCLRRSVALAECLVRRRLPFELVFGVALQPFAAHCWVQHEDVVLNDWAEEVDGYQPILVV